MNLPWKPGQPLTLDTPRYIVRSMLPADVNDDYFAWLRDKEIMAGVNSAPKAMTMDDIRKYVGKFNNRSSFHLGIFRKADDRLIGFYSVYVERSHGLASTNVVVGEKQCWGKGVVLETRAAIIDFLFDRLRVAKIWGSPMARNIPSVFNYKAQGFACEAVLKRHRVGPDGVRADQFMFALFPEQWRAVKARQAAKESKPT